MSLFFLSKKRAELSAASSIILIFLFLQKVLNLLSKSNKLPNVLTMIIDKIFFFFVSKSFLIKVFFLMKL